MSTVRIGCGRCETREIERDMVREGETRVKDVGGKEERGRGRR